MLRSNKTSSRRKCGNALGALPTAAKVTLYIVSCGIDPFRHTTLAEIVSPYQTQNLESANVGETWGFNEI
jgi:hypothetical protein